MPMTPFPTPLPSRTMIQTEFDAAMARHFAALPLFTEEGTALQVDVSEKQVTASNAANAAAESAGAAGVQAVIAATKAGEALASAGAASASAGTAASKLVDILALYDQFDDRYLGSRAADPALDNDGNALADGAFYINSVSGFLRAYTAAHGWVQGIASVAGVTSINGALTGAVTGIATVAYVDANAALHALALTNALRASAYLP